jgi:hypothetical protein
MDLEFHVIFRDSVIDGRTQEQRNLTGGHPFLGAENLFRQLSRGVLWFSTEGNFSSFALAVTVLIVDLHGIRLFGHGFRFWDGKWLVHRTCPVVEGSDSCWKHIYIAL